MKKLISLILILCMACMLVPAMAEDDILGDWYLTEVTVEGMTINPVDMGMNMTYTFKDGGVLEVTGEMMGETNTQTGTWSLDGSTLTMTAQEQDQAATFADGKITIEMDGQTGILTREVPAASEKAKTVAADSEEAFFGNWTMTGMDMMGMYVEKDGLASFGLTGYDVTMTIEAGKATCFTISSEGQEAVPSEMATEFKDGKLIATFDIDEETAKAAETIGVSLPASCTIELLEDGRLLYSTEVMGMAMGVYMAPAAAAEQPAA
jgi:hypothetical protein